VDETIGVRDHGRPCEHGSRWPHWIESGKARWWREPECPGGREMILRRLDDRTWMEVPPEDGGT
jgi:hypothetical protein